MDKMTWYNGLHKPSWTPAPATIGLIWQILYGQAEDLQRFQKKQGSLIILLSP